MQPDRRFLLAFAAAWLGVQAPAEAQPAPPQDRKISLLIDSSVLNGWPSGARGRVTVTEDHSPQAKEIAAATPPGRAIPIIVAVIGVLAIPVIWDTISELWTREHYGGVIIDLRTAEPHITTSKAVPARMVFVVAGDGKVTKYQSEDFSEQLLEKILPTVK